LRTFGRKRFSRHQRRPVFNRLTVNMEVARALGEGDGRTPEDAVDPPAHEGAGAQRVPKQKEPRDKAPGPMH